MAPPALAAEERPDAREVLRSVRVAQANQSQSLSGRLRNGATVSPFRLTIQNGTIRYEFSEPPQTIQLRLLEKDSRFEEVSRSGTEKISPARYDDRIRNTDIAYEDLAMKFLYWPNAVIEGEQTMLLRRCWIVRTEPPAKNDSQYSKVTLWIDKENGALMQAEAFDHAGKFAKRFKVISGQKIDGAWVLKQMRIEAASAGRSKDSSPTYLEIEKPN